MRRYVIDLPKLVADMLKEQWSLPMGEEPVIAYTNDAYGMCMRVGGIYVYELNANNTITTVDYRTIQRTGYASIKVMTPFRERTLDWEDEVIRILETNRRAGWRKLGGFSYLEWSRENIPNDRTGWWEVDIDVRFLGFTYPIKEAGFGLDCHGREIGPYYEHLPPGHDIFNGHPDPRCSADHPDFEEGTNSQDE